MSERAFKAFGVAVTLNFFVFWLVAVLHGGDALNGKVVNGHYYLGSHSHYTEVSHAFFVYSEIHTAISMAAIFAVGLMSLRRQKRRSN